MNTNETMTIHVRPALAVETDVATMLRAGTTLSITTAEDCVVVTSYLAALQKLRRFCTNVFKAAKDPVNEARRALLDQESAVVGPLETEEARIQEMIRAFQSSVPPAASLAGAAVDLVTLPALGEPTLTVPPFAPGVFERVTYSGTVEDVEALVLSVAGRCLLARGLTAAQAQMVTDLCHPCQQASLRLLAPVQSEVSALARALREDLAIPGVTLRRSTSMVAR